ncbi:ABC transporter permease [Streptomyces sp. NPDC059720]|uniref:ABC transporter permease n=1 Tax=Streptomyces sp. NPDC059720 TaxID=3346924 RepID=UPI0036737D8D
MKALLSSTKTRVGLTIIGLFVVVAVVGPWVAPYDPSAMSADVLAPPSTDHLLGTTQSGQDVFSQLLIGTRGVLLVGFLSALIATVLSCLVGITSGYLGGPADEALSAVGNVFLVLPGLPLIIIIASLLPESGDLVVAAVIGLTGWAWGARVLRAQTLSLRRRDYVTAARAVGEPTWRIIVFEVLPNLSAVIVSSFVGTVVNAVLSVVTLSFIGVVDLSRWNWGTILFWAQSNQALAQNAWWWFVPAGLCIALLGTALALVNFGIDELVNPRLRVRRTPLPRAERRSLTSAARRRARMRVGFTAVLPAPAPAETASTAAGGPFTGEDFAPIAPIVAKDLT